MSSVKQVAQEQGVTDSPISVRSLLSLLQVHTVRELLQKHEQLRQTRLQFRLRYFTQQESNDSGLQGPTDEVYLSALGFESMMYVGQDRQPEANIRQAPYIGDLMVLRAGWQANPHVLFEFQPYSLGHWPRTFTVTLLFVEEDQGDMGETFDRLAKEANRVIREKLVEAVTEAGEMAADATIGTLIPIPGLGLVIGAALGALSGEAWDALIGEIIEGWDHDPFLPRVLTLTAPLPSALAQHPDVNRELILEIAEQGALWHLHYDWHLSS
jgi:hypothetical protein